VCCRRPDNAGFIPASTGLEKLNNLCFFNDYREFMAIIESFGGEFAGGSKQVVSGYGITLGKAATA
jgi:hypothetical protein